MARLGKPEVALANYRKALELDPELRVGAFEPRRRSSCRQGKLEEAESHYRKALAGRPTAETHNGLGYVLARRGRTDEAIAEFRKAIEPTRSSHRPTTIWPKRW